jgi:hypothetical protein
VQRLERSVGLPRLTRAFVLVKIVRDIASTNLTREMLLASNELSASNASSVRAAQG